MKVKIIGSGCVSCYKYTQYYTLDYQGAPEAIDCGFCGIRQCTTRPGSRCKQYREKSNVGLPLKYCTTNQT